MGLFGKKEPCGICGGKVKGLFPHKIEGQYICSECYGVVDLPANTTNNMTMADFRDYMKFREENKLLKGRFKTTQKVDFGLLGTKFMFDMQNRLMCMDPNIDTTVFEAGQVKSFVIKEDSVILYEGNAAGLNHHISTVPERAGAMAPQILQAQVQRNLERMRERLNGDNGNSGYRTTNYDIPEPFEKFNVEIYFEHPYWKVFTTEMSGPTFNDDRPDLNEYMREYDEKAKVMDELAHALMNLAFPGAPEQVITSAGMVIQNSAPAVSAATTDAVEEIQKFKALMEQGIITEEEFSAKKRQILGI